MTDVASGVRAAAGVIPFLLAAAGGCAPAGDRAPTDPGFDFAVVGDTPYDLEGERLFPFLAEEIARADVDFVIHIGDVKGGGVPCSDSLVAARIRALDQFGHPLMFTPGDNDWTDCHRVPPDTYLPLERLAFLRTQAYSEPGRSLGTPPAALESQADAGRPEFPEHQRWTRGGVIFATIHTVGSRNGLVPFRGRTEEDDAEVGRRITAAVEWIRDTFAQARDRKALAVVLATQADPWIPPPAGERNGLEEIMTALQEEAVAFDRPVLFIHGDSHTLTLDRPFWSEENPVLPNVMRLQTYGAPDVGWVQVHVDPASRAVFGFTPRRVAAPR